VSNDQTITKLLDKWEVLRQQGQEPSVAELCQDAPELASELANEIENLKAMDWLDVPIPSSTDSREENPSESPDNLRLGPARVPAILGGRYEIESLMAEGGFGQVWRATDKSLMRPVAIKVTTIDCFSEARRVAQLKHQGIVTVHDVGNADGLCYIVFDLVDGITLADKIVQGPLSYRQAAQIVAEVAESLQFAHNKGFIHRDIKPANILLDANEQPILADFGIAVTECELRHEAMTSVGTLAYMAPEQLQPGGKIDVRTDIYGLGVVFYELLTGKRPYVHPTLSVLREKILAGKPPSPRSSNPAIPEIYERICLKCLSTNREDRYSEARALAAVLKKQLDFGDA
jgi:eukaryotic-like serine/threonine-protein kinase